MYILTLFCLLGIYGVSVFFIDKLKPIKTVNLIFPLSIFALYLALVLTVYFDVGFNDWNFQNTLLVANVSPFMFTIMPIVILMPKKINKYFYLLISLLSVGMLFSTVFGCLYNAIINYAFHPHFLLDYLAHILLSLWGVYFVKTNQVDISFKNSIISSLIIILVAVIMLLINLIFDTAFFGLSLTGKHNIYNVVLTSSSIVSAIIYFIGLISVLVLGYLYQKFIIKRLKSE